MIERLQNIQAKYKELVEELTHEDVLQDYNKLRKLSKEKADLEEIVLKYQEFLKCDETILEAKEMLNDPDMRELAEEEIATATESKERLEKELQLLLIPKDPNDDKNIIMEIRGAAGGDEARRRADQHLPRRSCRRKRPESRAAGRFDRRRRPRCVGARAGDRP